MQLRQTVKQNNTKTIRLVEEKAEAEKQLQLKERGATAPTYNCSQGQ